MTSIESVTLEVADPTAAERFYTTAFGLGSPVRLRASDTPTTGFRGFTLSLTVSLPATVSATKRFYVDHGLAVAKSFGRKYVQFDTTSSPVKLGLYGRRALAKDAGVAPDGTGSHRLVIGSDAGPFTDPDGFAWEAPL
jgi:catechol 2,3-dioxygenase-like lactoylglutathione lyase family enzyme